MRASYCTGINGKIANDEVNEMKYDTGVAGSAALAGPIKYVECSRLYLREIKNKRGAFHEHPIQSYMERQINSLSWTRRN